MKAWVPFAYCRCVFAMPTPVPAVGRVALILTAGHVADPGFPVPALVAMLTSPAASPAAAPVPWGLAGLASMTPC